MSDCDDESKYVPLRYRKAVVTFVGDRKRFEDAIPTVSQLSWQHRVKFVRNNYEPLLCDLYARPKRIKMQSLAEDGDELEIFCSAICIGWKLCPGWWMGLQMVLDYLGEETLPEDIVRIDLNTLRVLKEIALCTEWKNNPICGNILLSQAKNVIVRRFKNSSLPDKMTNLLGSLLSGITFTPSQIGGPIHSRRICNGIDCFEVESDTVKFKLCGRCGKVVYCSKSCQVKAWKKGHKQDCAN